MTKRVAIINKNGDVLNIVLVNDTEELNEHMIEIGDKRVVKNRSKYNHETKKFEFKHTIVQENRRYNRKKEEVHLIENLIENILNEIENSQK